MVIDFGAVYGLRLYRNDTSWERISKLSPTSGMFTGASGVSAVQTTAALETSTQSLLLGLAGEPRSLSDKSDRLGTQEAKARDIALGLVLEEDEPSGIGGLFDADGIARDAFDEALTADWE